MQVIELSHPLKSHYLTILRNENTNSEEFRAYATKLSYLLFIEGTKNISLVNSGTSAIHLALISLNVKPNDIILTQSFTFGLKHWKT